MPETPDSPMMRQHLGGIARRVYALVRACPAGRVTTYGWLGAAVGYPKAARVIGWIMNNTPRGLELPAQRVINSKGELTGSWAFGQKGRMRQLLESEGIVFSEKGTVDLKRYGWQPLVDLTDEERERIFAEADTIPAEPSDQLLHLVLDDPTSPFRIVPQQ
ncbi:MAG: MGMT family protein [Ktedonobacterales bacterium]